MVCPILEAVNNVIVDTGNFLIGRGCNYRVIQQRDAIIEAFHNSILPPFPLVVETDRHYRKNPLFGSIAK